MPKSSAPFRADWVKLLLGNSAVIHRIRTCSQRLNCRLRGSVFVEYILLVTLVGIGVLVGLAALRGALVDELNDLADAIHALHH